MAVDEALLEAAAAEGQCTMRFYQWAEPTLSLGYFQTVADRHRHPASEHCAMVRRQSGGGAILHDLELTYSLAVPEGHPLAADRLGTYRIVHEALIETLSDWGIEARLFVSPDAARPCGESTRGVEKRQPFLCFERRAPGDVIVRGVKIAGSAQRRWRGAVLQHGSLLLARSASAPELDGLHELLGKALRMEEVRDSWRAQLARRLAVAFRRTDLSDERRRRAAALAAEKYASPDWNEAR